ncbi:SWIB/MDM2 domain-containing protein [Mangrovicella endophytica]|uniref:SWIB/MDM2 domain-containing protein n=1 Tax=Mangrovicella endophytica TaxID=2066697 RepID=UPI000C9EB7A7|nr:SWIB/MDM2 domain-containing protein [Mangrovicella endophytica]
MAKKQDDVKPDTGAKPDAVHKLVQPSEQLAAVVGSKPLARGEVISRMWDYIKKNKLQDPQDGREINADDKLQAIFGKKKATMFEMNKYISNHLS